jgi:ParB-like nuclease domain
MDANTVSETTEKVGNLPTSKTVPIASLRSELELQPRAVAFVEAKVEEYTLALDAGDTLPPITVTERDGTYVVVIGHNRVEAYRRAGRDTIESEFVPDIGNKRLYWEHAVPSNATHGEGYSDDDKQAIFARFVAEGRHKLPAQDGR